MTEGTFVTDLTLVTDGTVRAALPEGTLMTVVTDGTERTAVTEGTFVSD